MTVSSLSENLKMARAFTGDSFHGPMQGSPPRAVFIPGSFPRGCLERHYAPIFLQWWLAQIFRCFPRKLVVSLNTRTGMCDAVSPRVSWSRSMESVSETPDPPGCRSAMLSRYGSQQNAVHKEVLSYSRVRPEAVRQAEVTQCATVLAQWKDHRSMTASPSGFMKTTAVSLGKSNFLSCNFGALFSNR